MSEIELDDLFEKAFEKTRKMHPREQMNLLTRASATAVDKVRAETADFDENADPGMGTSEDALWLAHTMLAQFKSILKNQKFVDHFERCWKAGKFDEGFSQFVEIEALDNLASSAQMAIDILQEEGRGDLNSSYFALRSTQALHSVFTVLITDGISPIDEEVSPTDAEHVITYAALATRDFSEFEEEDIDRILVGDDEYNEGETMCIASFVEKLFD